MYMYQCVQTFMMCVHITETCDVYVLVCTDYCDVCTYNRDDTDEGADTILPSGKLKCDVQGCTSGYGRKEDGTCEGNNKNNHMRHQTSKHRILN